MALEISVREVRRIAAILLENLGDAGDKITLDVDDYWDLSPSDRYNLDKMPTKFDVGKLSEDWELLLPVLRNTSAGVPYMFVHMAPLLNAIAEASLRERLSSH